MMLKTEKQIRFMIFGQGRSGSNLLVNLLASHPYIHCDFELLHAHSWDKISRRLILPFIRYYPIPFFIMKAKLSKQKAYGFKLFVNQVKHPKQVVTEMRKKDWRIICILRKDLIARAISASVAKTTLRWHRDPTESSDNRFPKITDDSFLIPPDLVLSRIKGYIDGQNRIFEALKGIPYLAITYEDDLADVSMWEDTSIKILSYLSLPTIPLKSDTLKIYDRPYSELISNYADIIETIRKSEFSYILDRSNDI